MPISFPRCFLQRLITLRDMLEERLLSRPKRRLEAAKVVMLPVGILPGSGSPYIASQERTSLRLHACAP